jgi:hypothetical protein
VVNDSNQEANMSNRRSSKISIGWFFRRTVYARFCTEEATLVPLDEAVLSAVIDQLTERNP